MKKTMYLPLLIIPFMLLFGSSVYGGWKQIIARNQIKGTEYIVQLQKGANPDKIARPSLRRGQKAKARVANREIVEAMDQAEKLARSGKYKLIKTPEFTPLLSDEGYQEVEKKYEEGN
ncbi:MAG: hypothetical protein ACI8ZB_004240 [Desulforhopalus sp.]|jgi:hypothetical protein